MTPILSPVGGHGFDPVSELGCNHVMFSVEFNGPESLLGVNYVPTDIDYRQIGILINPMDEYTYPYFANNSIYDLTTHFTVASGFGVYTSDETVVQVDVNSSSPTLGQTVFSATVLSFNTSTNSVKLINMVGTPIINQPQVAILALGAIRKKPAVIETDVLTVTEPLLTYKFLANGYVMPTVG